MKKVLLCCLTITLMLGACCTKTDCPSLVEPMITLYFPEATASYHTLTYTRLQKGSNKVIDSMSTRIGNKQWPFEPWYLYGEDNWGDYDYIVKLDEPTFTDTIYNISYNKVVSQKDCNECFPPSDRGKVEVVNYENLSFYHKGRQLYKGDTVLMVRR